MRNTNQKTKRYSVKAIEDRFNVFVERVDQHEDWFCKGSKWKAVYSQMPSSVIFHANTLADIFKYLEEQVAYNRAILAKDREFAKEAGYYKK